MTPTQYIYLDHLQGDFSIEFQAKGLLRLSMEMITLLEGYSLQLTYIHKK